MKLSVNLTEKLLDDKVISPEEKVIVQYGLENLGAALLGLLMSMIVGFWFGSVETGLLLACVLFPLRKNAGGYHAKTKGMCMFLSVMMLVIAFTFLYQWHWPMMIYLIVAAACAGIIWGIAPIGTPNKLLDKDERKVYGKRTRIILLVEGILFGLALGLGWEQGIVVITMAVSIVAMSLVVGKVRLYKLNL